MSEISVIPYIRVDGVPNFRDSQIMEFYDRMVEDGTASDVFYAGDVCNKVDFMRRMKDAALLLVAMKEGRSIGIGWVNGIEGKLARVHFAMFRESWGESEQIGKQMIATVMDIKSGDEFAIDSLYGFTPSKNRLAVEWVKRCGGVQCGELPSGGSFKGKTCGLVISHYMRGK